MCSVYASDKRNQEIVASVSHGKSPSCGNCNLLLRLYSPGVDSLEVWLSQLLLTYS